MTSLLATIPNMLLPHHADKYRYHYPEGFFLSSSKNGRPLSPSQLSCLYSLLSSLPLLLQANRI